MNRFNWFKMVMIQMALLGTMLTASAGEAKPSKQFWYHVTVAVPNSEGKYTFVGSSSLAEDEIVKALAKAEEFIKLDDCIYADKKGKYKSWHEWDPTVEPRLYLNPKHVLVVQPLVGDPRCVASDTKAKAKK